MPSLGNLEGAALCLESEGHSPEAGLHHLAPRMTPRWLEAAERLREAPTLTWSGLTPFTFTQFCKQVELQWSACPFFLRIFAHTVSSSGKTFPPFPSSTKFFFNVYLFLRKRLRKGQREKDRGSETGSVPTAESNAGLELVNREIVI